MKREKFIPKTVIDEDVPAFMGALAQAAKDGKKEFEFGGKTYKVRLKKDVVDKITKNMKESEDIDDIISALTEATASDYAKLSDDDLLDLISIFKGVGRSAAKPVVAAIKREMQKRSLKEEAELEEANNRLVAHTPAAAQRLIKKLKNKFSGYKWDDMVKGNEIIYPNEPHIKRFIKKQPEVADMKESAEIEEAIKVKTHRGMYSMKKGEESLRNWVDGIVIMSDAVKKNQRKTVAQNIVKAIETGKIKNADLTQDLGTLIGVKAPSGMEAPKSVVKDRMKELKLLESTDKDLDIKSIKDLIKNPSPKMIKQYGGKDKYIKMLKSKLAKLESIKENIGVEDGRRVVVKALTKPAALRLQKKLRNKFNSYDFNIDKSGLSIIVPNEKHITRFINKQPEVDTIGESVDFEKTNTLTVDEYDEVQNFQNFNKKDWRFDKKSKTYTRKKKV